jgi:Zn-dependent peptidase ImmA (M78 family)
MIINDDEIDELAHRVIAKYSCGIPVNPFDIAEKISVKIIYEPYDHSFKGFICYNGKGFYIILNKNLLKNLNYSITRYTIAHELGHYFIGAHRNRLKQGESFAFQGAGTIPKDKIYVEAQAEQFAASLLMPKVNYNDHYSESAKEGFAAILDLKNYFDVSITSAAIRFNKLNIAPCITVRWKEDKILGKGISNKFIELLDTEVLPEIKLNPERPKFEESLIEDENSGVKYHRCITPLSSWTYNIPKEFANRLFLIEETFQHSYGNLTLLRPI